LTPRLLTSLLHADIPQPSIDDLRQTAGKLRRHLHEPTRRKRQYQKMARDILAPMGSGPEVDLLNALVKLLLRMGYGRSAADRRRAIVRTSDDDAGGVIDQDALGLDRVISGRSMRTSSNRPWMREARR
jgi:restriction endonuclease Mrr